MKTEISNKKMLAIGLIAVLAIAVVSTTTIAFSQGQGERGEEGEEKGREKGGQEEEKAKEKGGQEEEEAREEKGKSQEEEEAREEGQKSEEEAREEGSESEKQARAQEERGRSKAGSAEQAAEQARAAAEAKGRPEVVENIEKAERYYGKSDKAAVALKIGLKSEDPDSISFGSAQLILIILGDRDPMFRAVINTVMAEPSDTLTACLDGSEIGELTTTPASEEMGLVTGHLRANLLGVSISLPGINVDIVEGNDCSGTQVLSGSI